MKRGRPKGSKNPQIDRYAAVKLRQRLRASLSHPNARGSFTLYKEYTVFGWVPNKSNGEPIEELAFRNQYQRVKKDRQHPYPDFFVRFLHRAALTAYKAEHRRGKPPNGYNGVREIKLMTGLQETTIKDILILNGEIR